jgi:ribosome-interacting GTPase 1
MPANLTPQYLEAEARFKAARETEEKIEALEGMLSVIPRHKGTEKLQADLKRRLSKLRTLASRRPPRRADVGHHVEREGAGQVVLAGPPNSGKSSLLRALTHATPEVADYPFTTRAPLPGMMSFEDVRVQLVDLPPFHPDSCEPWMLEIARRADAALLVVDLHDADLLEELESALGVLAEGKLWLEADPSAAAAGVEARRCLVVGNKSDTAEAVGELEVLREFYGERFPLVAVSAATGAGLDPLRQAVFELLELVRVYTKPPGKKPEHSAPYVLRRGARLEDLAAMVHKDFVTRLRFARVWGHGRFDGQMVNRDYPLRDRDLIELHT